MTRRSLGFIFLGLGLAPLAGGLLLFFSGIFTLDQSLNPVARITSPGEIPVKIDEAGVYTLWSDRKRPGRIPVPRTLGNGACRHELFPHPGF